MFYLPEMKSVSIPVGLAPLMSFSNFWYYWASRISPAEIAKKLSVATTKHVGSLLPPHALWLCRKCAVWRQTHRDFSKPRRGSSCRLPQAGSCSSASCLIKPLDSSLYDWHSLVGQADRAIWNRGLGKELVLDHEDLPESYEIPMMPRQPGEVGGKVKDQWKQSLSDCRRSASTGWVSEWVRRWFHFSNASHLSKMLPSPSLRVCLKRDTVHVPTGKHGLSRSVEA